MHICSGYAATIHAPREGTLVPPELAGSPVGQVRRIELAELPKPVSGKIRRVEFRRREVERPDKVAAAEWRDDQFPQPAPALSEGHAAGEVRCDSRPS